MTTKTKKVTKIEVTIENFVARAEKLGATVTQKTTTMPKPGLHIWSSAPQGDCGSSGCRCSPGIWTAIADGPKYAIAHFCTNFERGDDAEWSTEQYLAWAKFKKEFRDTP